MTSHLKYGGPDAIGQTRSLKAIIDRTASAGRTLNIVFVHGIRARGPGEAGPLIEGIAERLGVPVPSSDKILLDVGPWPEGASMMGGTSAGGRTPIWRSEEEWQRSRPFVERTEISWGDGAIRIHEVNYWPLLFPLKARFLLIPEHDLSGNDVQDLDLVKDWLDPGELERLKAERPASGGGAKANAFLKQQIMNWGLSDAVIALGPMRHYLHETVDQALTKALADSDDEDEYVVASLSLGSFVVMDAYAAGRQSVQSALDRTGDLYFFANQFALLELARIKGLPHRPGAPDTSLIAETDAQSPMEALQRWANGRRLTALADQPKQIISFSDPSDLLTYLVPKLADVVVVNVFDRNATDFLDVLENPITAHTGHLRNSAVWDLLWSG